MTLPAECAAPHALLRAFGAFGESSDSALHG